MLRYQMPKNATLDSLSACCTILSEYREAGCPGFPKSNPFVDRLTGEGNCTLEEAIDLLAITWDNYEEVV